MMDSRLRGNDRRKLALSLRSLLRKLQSEVEEPSLRGDRMWGDLQFVDVI